MLRPATVPNARSSGSAIRCTSPRRAITDTPNLIVNVETTPASTPDDNMGKVVHESLEKRELLPTEHLVDKGYTDSHMLVASEREYGVTIVGPVAEDPSWQARQWEGFDKSQFAVDWERHVVTCPVGKQSISWLPNTYPQNGMVHEVRFVRKDCTPCSFRAYCTKAKMEPRIIGLQAREHDEALQAARKRQTTEEFRQQYGARAGVEGTHAQGIRRCGLRQSRSLGRAKTHLQESPDSNSAQRRTARCMGHRDTSGQHSLFSLCGPSGSIPVA
jgi:transposase